MKRSRRSCTAWRPSLTCRPSPSSQFPGAALVEADAGETQAGLEQAALRLDVELRDVGLAAVGAFEQRQFRRHVTRVADEELAARVEQARVVPARRGHLLVDDDADRVGPHARDDGVVDPVDRLDALRGCARGRPTPGRRAPPAPRPLSISGGATRWNGPSSSTRRTGRSSAKISSSATTAQLASDRRRGADRVPVEPLVPVRLACASPGVRGLRRERQRSSARPSVAARDWKLVSSTRQTSSSNSMPRCRAAFGTSEWLVMPGAVLTSSSHGLPARSRMKSTRPQPLQSDREERRERERLQFLFGRARETGAEVLRVVGDVLGVVVVVLAGRHDADRRQRLGAEDARPCIPRPGSAARPAAAPRSAPRVRRPRRGPRP